MTALKKILLSCMCSINHTHYLGLLTIAKVHNIDTSFSE